MVDKADTLTFTRQHDPPLMVAGSPAALYVHIPFCRHLCPFCPYNKIAYEPALAARYIRALRAEIRRSGEQCGRLNIGSLYFGGGTPTTVLDELDGVMDDLRGSFKLSGHAAIETTPAGLTRETAAELRRLGFGLISLGVQSYQDRFLRHIGRPYNGTAAGRACAMLMDAGFQTVNFDLMFAMPGQTTDDLRHDLLDAIRYGPDQITCYPLFTFPYASVDRWRTRNRVVIPNQRLRWRMYRIICETLAEHGYMRASVWSFTRSNTTPFSSVTRDRYLGFGAGAASYNGRSFTFNTFSVPAYNAALEDGRYPTAIGMPVSTTLDRMFWLYWRLYETRVPKAAYRALFGRDPERDFAGIFRLIRGLGFVEDESDDWLTLNTRGCHWVHLAQNLLALNDVNTVWSAARATAYPDRICL
ncbi:MAG: radical SAM protein [Verrucomicrobiota bacterium]